ncbi:MAG: MFS transporter [Hyphomonadaceae bacterium]|nr:MFS transporter [Hyphomonadaceae bacterium]
METAATAAPAKPVKKQHEALVIGASSVGTMFEWYDFFLYGSLITNINQHFFTGVNEVTGYILALATFAAGFLVRPFGALVFGRIGDIVGRKNTFLVTMIIMGASTFAVGLLPGSAQIGILAPILLVSLRVLQGLAIGGEYGGAAIYVAEHAPKNRRGFYTSWIQITATIGLLLSLVLILTVRKTTSPEAFNEWGWRIPFLLSIFLLGISVWIRLQLQESPVFQKMKDEQKTSKAPWAEAFGKWSNAKYVIIALFGLVAGQGVIWYTGTFYSLFFLQNILKVDGEEVNIIVAIALVLGTPIYSIIGWLSDKIGRRYLALGGLALGALTYFSLFHMMTEAANPALAKAQATAPVVVMADTSACSLQFDPVGKNKFDTLSCDIVKAHLARAGVSYTTERLPAGSVAQVTVGGQTFTAPDPRVVTGPERATAIAAYQAEAGAALATAGYPPKADTAQVDRWTIIGIIVLTQLFTAMIYGPMAATLVELFPARIRYTSMSLPYHIGNGWFGGMLPTIAFATVAATGNIYAGIWYPVIVAGFTFVVAVFFLPETYKREIHHT